MSQKGRIFREEHGLKLSLLEIAQRVHCAQSGSYQPANKEEIELYVQVLEITLDDWETSRSNFEHAVKLLLESAFVDGVAYLT